MLNKKLVICIVCHTSGAETLGRPVPSEGARKLFGQDNRTTVGEKHRHSWRQQCQSWGVQYTLTEEKQLGKWLQD